MLITEKKLLDKITDLKADIKSLRSVKFSKRAEEIEEKIDNVTDEEEIKDLEAQLEDLEKEKEATEEEIKDLEAQLAEAEKELEGVRKKGTRIEERKEKYAMTKRSKRIFDSLPFEERARIVNAEEVKGFTDKLRSAIKEKRAITNGSLTIPVVMLDLIKENIYNYSKLLEAVRVRQVNGEARQTVIGTIPEAIWTEACASVNELSFAFNQMTLDGYKVAGYIPLCNSLAEDSAFDLAAEIIEILGEAVGYAVDKAILYGKGASSKMPMGIVTRLAQATKPENYPANAPAWADLHATHVISVDSTKTGAEFYSELLTAASVTANKYARGEMFWAMNSKTYYMLKAKAITFDFNGMVVAGVNDVMPGIGGRIVVLEFIPDGDIIGGYGDLYLLGERKEITISSSEHVQFIEDNTVYKAVARYDGVPVIAEAFVIMNINGGTPTTTMTFPSAS